MHSGENHQQNEKGFQTRLLFGIFNHHYGTGTDQSKEMLHPIKMENSRKKLEQPYQNVQAEYQPSFQVHPPPQHILPQRLTQVVAEQIHEWL